MEEINDTFAAQPRSNGFKQEKTHCRNNKGIVNSIEEQRVLPQIGSTQSLKHSLSDTPSLLRVPHAGATRIEISAVLHKLPIIVSDNSAFMALKNVV
ncbi:hypothetical protein evm_003304 [Chilo suppressalis]|nr:hypothetical protein evm_003304 [Chilo suppressalis]